MHELFAAGLYAASGGGLPEQIINVDADNTVAFSQWALGSVEEEAEEQLPATVTCKKSRRESSLTAPSSAGKTPSVFARAGSASTCSLQRQGDCLHGDRKQQPATCAALGVLHRLFAVNCRSCFKIYLKASL
jgi:hypothetical protein